MREGLVDEEGGRQQRVSDRRVKICSVREGLTRSILRSKSGEGKKEKQGDGLKR